MSEDDERIVQIIPAVPGYYARYSATQADERDCYGPVAAWALLENGRGERRLVGVDVTGGDGEWTPDAGLSINLAEYVHSAVPLDTYGTPMKAGKGSLTLALDEHAGAMDLLRGALADHGDAVSRARFGDR
jgi:hypothetical protein